MITARPTEHLIGVTIEGDFNDFYELVESIYRITGLEEDYEDEYWSVKNRLLGMCYDIRHAYMGDREIRLIENGVHDELMKYHSMVMPKKAVYFSANFLFPEAVFVALSVSELCIDSLSYYGQKRKDVTDDSIQHKYSDYLKDTAILQGLAASILSALADVIGDKELEDIIHLRNKKGVFNFLDYATQYLDKCNIDYIKTAQEKRKDKLKNIVKRLIQKPDAYKNMKSDLERAALHHGCSYHELHDPRMEYPDEIEW